MDTMRTWQGRFADGGLPALADRRRSGRPAHFTPVQVAMDRGALESLPAWRLIVALCEIDLVNSADRSSSWFNALSKSQQVIAIVMSLIGSIGGAACLWFGPPMDAVPAFLILAYVFLSLMILNGIPRVHLWFDGRGVVLYLGVFSVLKGASRDLETPAIRVSVFVVGVLLLTYLIVRAVRIERKQRQTGHAKPQIL